MSEIDGQGKREPGPPDLTHVVQNYFWRVNEATRMDEYVRASDGFVVDRKPLHKQERKENPMRDEVKKRVEALIGKKAFEPSHLTVRSIAGSHPTSGTVMVNAECDCGTVIEAMLSEMSSGKRVRCGRQCKLSPEVELAAARKSAKRTAKPTKKRGAYRKHMGARAAQNGTRPKPRPHAETPDVSLLLAQQAAGEFSLEIMLELRDLLEDEARLLRRAAVALVRGTVDPGELVQRMREQADKIDKAIYQ